MRIIVMGTGPFAVPSMDSLLRQGHDIPLVVTRPQLPAAAKKPTIRPVAEWAAKKGLELFEPESINAPAAIDRLRMFQADLFFVCDYGQILSRACLSASRMGGVNLHGSILPRHRGAAPVQWCLLSGDCRAGVTTILMTPKLDGGPALAVRETEILPDETAAELEPRLAELGVDATLDAVHQLENWDTESAIGQIQDNRLATRAPRFEKHHGQLDFRLEAEYLVRLIRACQPWPGTFANLLLPGGKQVRMIVRSARCIELTSDQQAAELLSGNSPGVSRILLARDLGLDWTDDWATVLAVQTAKGVVLINRVQPAGKREMSAAEFSRGHSLGPGTTFELPTPPILPLKVQPA